MSAEILLLLYFGGFFFPVFFFLIFIFKKNKQSLDTSVMLHPWTTQCYGDSSSAPDKHLFRHSYTFRHPPVSLLIIFTSDFTWSFPHCFIDIENAASILALSACSHFPSCTPCMEAAHCWAASQQLRITADGINRWTAPWGWAALGLCVPGTEGLRVSFSAMQGDTALLFTIGQTSRDFFVIN